VRDFYRGSAAEQVGLLLRQYDVFNVKTILRGVSRGVPPAALVEQTLPAGALAPGALVDLARAESTAAVVSLLATWRSPLAAPLLVLLAEQPQASLAERERALDRWWSRAAWQASAAPAWRENLVEQIDSENIMVALRFVGVPLDVERLSAQFLALPEAGNALLAPTILLDAALAPDIRTAVARLASTSYAPTLNDALGDYSRRGRRSEFEIALARRRLQRAARLFHQDPLGIGVPLGYTILKRSEVRNLRLVGHGLFLGDPPERIVERLVTA
jgi:V/A-type H+-transporting ATPase subunit C